MQTETATVTKKERKPQSFKYELFLEHNPESKTGELVRVTNGDDFWIADRSGGRVEFLQKGDQVQFVIATEIAPHVEEFGVFFKATKPGTADGPFGAWDKYISDSSTHTVQSNNTCFRAMFWIKKGGFMHSCVDGGHVVCPNPKNGC